MTDKTFKWKASLEMFLFVTAFSASFYWEGDTALKILLMLIFLLLMFQMNQPKLLLDRINEEFLCMKNQQSICLGQLYALRYMLLENDKINEHELPVDWKTKFIGELESE